MKGFGSKDGRPVDEDGDGAFRRLTHAAKILSAVGLSAAYACPGIFFQTAGTFSDAFIHPDLLGLFLAVFFATGFAASAVIFLVDRYIILPDALKLAIGAVLCVGSFALFYGGVCTGSALAIVLSGISFGLGDTVFIFFWFYRASLFGMREIPLLMAAGLTMARMIQWVILNCATMGESLLAAGAVVAIATAAGMISQPLEASTEKFYEHQQEEGAISSGRLVRYLWAPLAGLGLCSLILGMVWNTQEVGNAPDLTFDMLGYAAVLIAFLLGEALAKRTSTEPTWPPAILPVAAALMLVTPFLPASSGGVAKSLVSRSAFALFDVTAWSVTCFAVKMYAQHNQRIIAMWHMVGAGSMLLGMLVFSWIGTTSQSLCVFLNTGFMLALCLFGKPAAQAEETVAAFSPCEDKWLDAVYEKYHLSERETEIARYLAKGYSLVYVAEQLVLSVNTVKTHARHIYEKIGVHSRDELVAKLDWEAKK